ncbi:hypothetical protein GDO78_011786 [Eleutherodactylus coqui]|uniref:ATP-dependent RNA helicase DDX60 n=1 Tax=Eleutherodactylus coqui TaxID=57060 RepID=A0A8J6F1E1_ELECQ|nr:hypothetical protein GDO78_011786 [Eleutherodactylus coqui]
MSQQHTFASLFNDFVESEVFVIDGDSLLLFCASDESLQKGQSLHFFFLVERFLLKLTDKGARYVVVFFQDMEETYSQCPVLKSWRTQLKIHLPKNTNTTVYTFPNFFSAEWKFFLKDQSPYFLMVSGKGMTSEQTCFLNMLMLDSLANKIDVVLTAGQESDHLRVYGYYIRSSLQTRILITEVQICITLLPTHQKDARAITCVVACSMALRIYSQIKPIQDINMSLTLKEASDLCKMQCFCVALMIILPLSQRARIRKLNVKWDSDASSFINMMQDDSEDKTIDWTYVSDIRDDLLLKNIVFYFEKESTESKLEFGNEINELYKCLWETVLQLVPLSEHLQSDELRNIWESFLSQDLSIPVETKDIFAVGLIPIRSDIIEDYAGDMIKELPALSSTETYDELLHWHVNRPLSDDYDRTKCEEKPKDKFALRRYQKLQTLNHLYGQSLGVKTPKKIVLQSDQPEEKSSAHKTVVKKKEPQKKKKDQIIEANLKKSKAEEEKKEQDQWKYMSSKLEKEINGDFFFGLKNLENFISSVQTPHVKYQAQLRALAAGFEKWTKECKMKSTDQRNINIVVEIMKIIHALLNTYQGTLQKEDQHRIATYLSKLGFDNLACSLRPTKLSNHKEEEKEKRYAVGVRSARFQLQYMGPHMLRDERSDPDPRVQHFIPDTWQRELLDAVDNNESAVIVAPTSSGKTYASYYCMQKVLTQSNEAVIVYVAPTKALVNQVAATVMSQFNKDLPNGVALCGVFTRDYRNDALNSQVLVTVPQCFEILLLSPRRQEWVKRIKYVIFDEIHCLGGEIGGETWEHILSVIRCPFLALSATISNPEHLTEWLQSVQKYWQRNDEREGSLISKSLQKGAKKKSAWTERRSYNVRIVQYDKRYNDLEKYICSVQGSDINFEHYHPCAFLTIEHIKSYGIPKDLTFSPRESIQMYDCMVNAWPKMPNLKALDPEENVHLKDKIIITKNDATEYEKALKKEFADWVQKGQDKETFLQICERTNYSRNKKNKNLINLSRKGIGYHHASIDAKGRRHVEMLFRMGYVRVVTCTSSLALGINMPCKSVVFLHDSPFLDALNYRQMAGRAGRRGEDLVGNVYFFNIPMPKVKKLLKSDVPQLRGQFPLSVTLILRLMLLVAKANDKQDAKAKVLSLLMHPLMSFKQPQEAQVLKLYCIFSLQFLLYEGLLNQDCDPIAFTGLVTHLHYHEPSNFVFVRFLEKGLFHQLCKPSSKASTKFPDSVMETLVLILAHLFGRRYLPPNLLPGEGEYSQSKVFLDKLPDDFASVIEEYNRKVATLFGQCILAGSKLADTEKEQQLPLSKIKFSGKECMDSGLVNHLMSCYEGRSGITPFACLSGNADINLMSMSNLSSLMMQTAHIPEKHIPFLHCGDTDISGGKRYLNAYALDFYKHGCLEAIENDNGFNFGEAYYALRDFYLTIAAISVSLTELCESDPVAMAFEQLKSMYHEKLKIV